MAVLDLSQHFRHFRARKDRFHLAAHSHHYWPDVTRAAQLQAWDDAAEHADDKWRLIFSEVVPAVQRGIAKILNLPDPATIAFAPNTHDFVTRLLSALPHDRPARILTTDGEFHSFARQIARLEEEGLVAVERVAHEPAGSFAERLQQAAAKGGHDLVFVSQILFNAGVWSGDIRTLAEAVPDRETLIVIDGYHGFMAVPTDLARVADRVFYLSGGYKYAMAGENVCFIHCPEGYALRPRDTGWFASFGNLSGAQDGVPYDAKGGRFWGATFDPVGFYRQRAVFAWMEAIGLTVDAIHAHALRLQDLFLYHARHRPLPGLAEARLVTPVNARQRGHFLTFETPDAHQLHAKLAEAGVICDVRGDRLRFGFGIHQTEEDVLGAIMAIDVKLHGETPQLAAPPKPLALPPPGAPSWPQRAFAWWGKRSA
jgi:selenocysteine lyase/cysteine desulfurase